MSELYCHYCDRAVSHAVEGGHWEGLTTTCDRCGTCRDWELAGTVTGGADPEEPYPGDCFYCDEGWPTEKHDRRKAESYVCSFDSGRVHRKPENGAA